MNKTNVYRHGEIAFVQIDALPSDLQKSESKDIIKGQTGNSHSISCGDLYFQNKGQYIFGYLVAKNTILLHSEHGDEVKEGKKRKAYIPDGIYELRKQQEFINNELQPVID